MKICRECNVLYQQQVMSCQECKKDVEEISFGQVLELTQKVAFRKHIGGEDAHELTDPYKQYHIRSYLKDRSLFLEFDLYKNRLKHGNQLKRFFIAPINVTAVINLPWFFFNIVASNLFQMQHTKFCRRCNSKYIPGQHSTDDCDYNIEYFHILDDILSGEIVNHKAIYHAHFQEMKKKGSRSAYGDLFDRPVRWEGFLDLLSIGLSIAFWLYVAANISYPYFEVLMQKLNQIGAYELGLP